MSLLCFVTYVSFTITIKAFDKMILQLKQLFNLLLLNTSLINCLRASFSKIVQTKKHFFAFLEVAINESKA